MKSFWLPRPQPSAILVGMELAARGYPPAVTAELPFEVTDDLFPENTGTWTLAVAEQRGAARRAGTPRLRATIRGLAALYSGYRTARQLALTGWLEGDDETLTTAETLFTGPSPWMADMF